MTPDAAKPADDWERFRDFLSVLARVQCSARWQGKVDLSGVVQQTLLEAYRAGDQLAGAPDAQKAAWLKRALTNNLADEVRKRTAARRGAGRERSLEAEMDESMSRLERLLPATTTTPSRQVMRQELLLQVARALSALPESQRRAIELHYVEGRPLAEAADLLATTRPAVAGLLHRGLKQLRQRLADEGAGQGGPLRRPVPGSREP
jgi:RNA polymerase sigma-70 factor (ECF subfamily)